MRRAARPAALACSGFRVRRRFLKRLGLLGAGLAVGFGLSEVAVRLFVAVRNVGPSFSVYDPAYGKRLKKNLTCTRITCILYMLRN